MVKNSLRTSKSKIPRVWTPTGFLGELDETARWKHSLDGPKVLMIFYNFLT